MIKEEKYTIWKYVIEDFELNYMTIERSIPKNAKLLSAIEQNNKVVIYFLVDTTIEKEKRYFVVLPTGNSFTNNPQTLKFIGTVELYGGDIIAHVFEQFEDLK